MVNNSVKLVNNWINYLVICQIIKNWKYLPLNVFHYSYIMLHLLLCPFLHRCCTVHNSMASQSGFTYRLDQVSKEKKPVPHLFFLVRTLRWSFFPSDTHVNTENHRHRCNPSSKSSRHPDFQSFFNPGSFSFVTVNL